MIATQMTAPDAALSEADQGSGVDQEGRIERWIVRNLENDGAVNATAISGLRLAKTASRGQHPEGAAIRGEMAEPWTRFQVVRRREITVVKLLDSSLVRENLLAELDDELNVLLDAGVRRIVLDFARVERLSCHLIVTLAKAFRRCSSTVGGLLRICRLRTEVAEILALAGLVPQIENFPDEKAAVDSPWPGPSVILPLPISILSALSSRQALGPGDASSRPVVKDSRRSPASGALRLVVETGRSAGKAIPLDRPRVTIGREPGCDLRFHANSVSRLHARIERRGDRIVLRDLGSTNGTLWNGQLLRDEETAIAHGDRIEIGGTRFAVAFDGDVTPDERIAGWLADDEREAPDETGDTLLMRAYDGRPAVARAKMLDLGLPDDKIKCEVIEDVLILTPMTGHLDDEATVDTLRQALLKILEGSFPSRLVINLAYVGHVSSLAIGVLVAHQLRLQRAGGAMRFCLAQPLVLSYLTLIRLPMLVECYPTMDDAVLTSW